MYPLKIARQELEYVFSVLKDQEPINSVPNCAAVGSIG